MIAFMLDRGWGPCLPALATNMPDGRAGRICPRGPASHAYKHGHAVEHGGKSREYLSWRSMIQRCTDVNAPQYPRYGGRGIKVCERWSRFENFLLDMGPRPPRLTLERVDNDGDYEPNNCVWATRKAQAVNMRTNVNITIGGVTKCLYDWCREYGLDPGTVRYRMRKFGWGPEEAVTTPKMRDRTSAFAKGGSRHAVESELC